MIMIVNLWGKSYDLSLDNIFPKPGDPDPVSRKLRKHRKRRQQKRLVANASRRRNRGNV